MAKSAQTRDLSEMDVDEFLGRGLDTDSEDEDSNNEEVSEKQDAGENIKQNSGKKVSAAIKHKQSLGRLKEQDPEFYQFLKKEDQKLLDFDASGGSSGDDSEDDSEKEEIYHKPPKKLEVASDDSEAEEPDSHEGAKLSKQTKSRQSVTLKMVKQWAGLLRGKTSLQTFHQVVMAFKAAVQQAGSDSEENEYIRYKVEGSAVFNAIVRLCLTEVPPMLSKFLDLRPPKDPKKTVLPSMSKNWARVRLDLKAYLTEVIQLMSQMAEASILNVLLKHVNQMALYYCCFPRLLKIFLKKLIGFWSTGEETTRVLAFLSINKIVRAQQKALLEISLKQMYMAYVKNCKFTTPSILPMINFMQLTLVEMFAIDVHMAYQYAFVYIRQLAIHLRNAITVKKKDNYQAVHNWQYIHSLHLWARLLGAMYPNEVMEPLIYPLTQVIIGTIKLIPTERFYPLRFHCVRTLNLLSANTNTFIPVLPFLIEVMEVTDFNKKHASISFKPHDFACILKLSKAQLQEKSFRDGVIDQLYELLLEQLHIHAHTISFPELVLPAIVQMKQFLKKCKVANYTKQIKQLLGKIEETNNVIQQRRKSASLNIADNQAVTAWEVRSKEEGTPIGKYYVSWRKLRDRELRHEIAGKDRISMDDLPTIERQKGPRKATEEEKKEFADLFETDSDESDDETRFMLKSERPKKKQKTKQANEDESDSDQYSDFNEEELEQLARSASEEEDEDEESGEQDSEEEAGDSGDEDEEESEDGDSAAEEDEDSDAEDVEDIVEDFKFSDEEDS